MDTAGVRHLKREKSGGGQQRSCVNIKGSDDDVGTWTEGVEENIWTEERRSDRRLEKTT
jgi:hypothetical protein